MVKCTYTQSAVALILHKETITGIIRPANESLKLGKRGGLASATVHCDGALMRGVDLEFLMISDS